NRRAGCRGPQRSLRPRISNYSIEIVDSSCGSSSVNGTEADLPQLHLAWRVQRVEAQTLNLLAGLPEVTPIGLVDAQRVLPPAAAVPADGNADALLLGEVLSGLMAPIDLRVDGLRR